MTKRAFDLVLATVGLIVLSPVLVAIAAWVRIDSPGPALFRQERVGRHGRPFTMLKFRTMRAEPAAGASLLTLAADDRVTRAGRFLRRTKLDELAQLHQNRWTGRGKPGVFASSRFIAFHRDLVARAFPSGGVQLLRIRAGAMVIGLLYNFIYKGRVYFYQGGLRFSDDNRLKRSPPW